MKTRLASIVTLLSSIALQAQTITIQEAAGWLESAYVKWTPITGADRYNVYYSGNGVADKKIDDPLIRSYGSYFRADVPGLKAGSYTIKVAPVISGSEKAATTSSPITVIAQDRSGFAFSNNHVPSAYNADGTPRSGAVILYITQKTKDTVSLTVTGATANPCKGLQTILDAVAKGKDSRPLIFRLVGQVTDPATLLDGDIVIGNKNNDSSHITLEGVGDDAVADGWGIRVKGGNNVEIRNIGIMNVNSGEGDNIGLQQDNKYIWVHNTDHFYGMPGSDADQFKGDGSLDCKKSTYVTFSYNHFWDNGKSNLLGLSEGTTDSLYITYHHNWYDHSDSRHPRVRYYSAHVYNNYYDGNSKYGVGSTLGSSVFVEANLFRNCKYPILTAKQGSDVWIETSSTYDHGIKGTFSNEDGGSIKAWNNVMSGQHRFVAYGASDVSGSTAEFDAYVAKSRSELMPNTVKSYQGANVYNNFDMNTATMYGYTADAPEAAKTKVTTYAGRVSGGDIKWTFNNAVDDTASELNAPLKTALTNYRTPMVYIQGEGVVQWVSNGRRPATMANPIRFDVRTSRLAVAEGYALRSVRVYSTNGFLMPCGSDATSLEGLREGIYLVRIATDRGAFEQTILKSN